MIAAPPCRPRSATRPGHRRTVTLARVDEPAQDRRIRTAELLSIGTELTVGDTRDTNAGHIARSLTAHGVYVTRLTALPDRLDVVADAFATALGRVDLVVSTGGLGPTPDDLTREAIARVIGEDPSVDSELEAWLRDLWARRDLPFPESNVKQAWLIPSAVALANPNGTAPGWLVKRLDGRVLVALPGPPREMEPMWRDEALPRLIARGLGADVAFRTYRLMDIGESQVAEVLGEVLLRRSNPEVATYARADGVDVRVSATSGPDQDGVHSTAEALVAAAGAVVEARLGDHVWATGDTSWPGAIGDLLAARGWRLAVSEVGTGGQLGALVGDVDWLAIVESIGGDTEQARSIGSTSNDLVGAARRVAELVGCEVGLAVRTHERGADTAVSVAVAWPGGEHVERRMAFLGGRPGRARAALVAAAVLLKTLRALGEP